MSGIPALPAEISPNGKEVWDWAAKLSDRAHKVHKYRELRAQLDRMQNRCGSCELWMTRACPRETHSNQTGRSTGPSGEGLKCGQFAMKRSVVGEIERAQAALEIIKQELS